MMSETKQPTMSRRAREAQPFRAMVFGERADEMIARSISVIKLSLGEPDFGAPPAVRDAMREQYDGRALPYTAALGLPELRRAIADFYHERHHVDIDPRRIVWKRAVDMNDRQLRHIIDGLGGKASGVPREDGFEITVASEIMAVLCLSSDLADLKARLAKMVVAYTYDDQPVTAHDLKAEGAMAALLKDAIKPNLVQTLEGTPAFIHGGPFANIAHGCNSLQATETAMRLSDYTVTEGNIAGYHAKGNVTSVPISITRADMWSAFDKGQTATYEASFTNVKETVAALPLSGASEGRTWLVVAGVTALVLLLAGIVGLALIGRGRP